MPPKKCFWDNLMGIGLILFRKHKPSKPVIFEHQHRDSYRLEPTQTDRKRKRVRITPQVPRITPPTSSLSKISGRRS